MIRLYFFTDGRGLIDDFESRGCETLLVKRFQLFKSLNRRQQCALESYLAKYILAEPEAGVK